VQVVSLFWLPSRPRKAEGRKERGKRKTSSVLLDLFGSYPTSEIVDKQRIIKVFFRI
jgi:hypothetical protein